METTELEVLTGEEVLTGGGVLTGEEGDVNEVLKFNLDDKIFNPDVKHELKPIKGQEFDTLEDVKLFYNTYAKEAGFSFLNWSTRKNGINEILRKEFVCYKQGNSSRILDIEKKRRRGTTTEGCNAKLAVVKSKSGTFVVTIFVEGHSHPLSTPRRTHLLRSHRSVSNAQKSLTQQMAMVNIPPHQQFSFLGVQAGGIENIGCTQNDLYNYERDRRNEMKGHDGNMLFEYFKLEQGRNPSFTFKIEADEQNRITRCFWSDSTSRRAYSFYGDVVIFDTTYNTNRYSMIFAPLMGINNHGQTMILACAFLSDETVDSFVWLFNQFLDAMPGRAPKMIITDQDPAMAKAIEQTLPNTFHRYCSWHILMKFSEKLDSLKYSAYYKEFSNCIWNSETKEEFDSKWMELVIKSGLSDNQWLHNLYVIRSRWVSAYVHHIFSAGMSSSQRAESAHSFFKKYVSKSNSLVDFMIQFGRGLERQRHEELIADNKDMVEKPKLKMPHDFLVHMVEIYTRETFFKFQDELWESLNYKFELINDVEDHQVYKISRKNGEKYKVREIIFDKGLGVASCSCKKFESFGIPCRHILGFLNKMTDFDKLPDHYIMKRWTKSAKSGPCVDDVGMEIVDDRSFFMKRSQLIKFSIGVLDKALESKETTKMYTDSISRVLEQINQRVGSGTSVRVSSEQSNQLIGCGTSVPISQSCEQSYHEPSQVRAKGCGKRLKGGKEKALGRVKKYKGRRCHGCGKLGQSHDKRNCPLLANRQTLADEDSTPDESTQDLETLNENELVDFDI